MNKKIRFHIVFTLHYLRYGLVLCLVPMLDALLRFDLHSLWVALMQDAAIVLASAAAALLLWRAAWLCVHKDMLHVHQGIFFKNSFSCSRSSIAVVEIVRPLYCRLLGASRMTIYFKTNANRRSFTLYLSKKDAAEVADLLMPLRTDTALFAPTGFERLAFVMLSANILTSTLFGLWGLKQLDGVLNSNLQRIALDTFYEAELFAARWMPAGLAFLVTLGFAVMGFSMLYSLMQTARFTVCRAHGVILSKGGLLRHTERRIRVSCVSACDICTTLPARLLRRYPVYLSAGSFRGRDLPVLVMKKGQAQQVETLLPNFSLPDGEMCCPERKSPVQYLWKPGAVLLFSLALCGVASYVMPPILPMLFLPVVLSLLCLAVSAEGFFREGLHKNKNRTLSVCYSRGFTRHDLCVFTPDLAYTLRENPFSVSRGRCDVTVHLPCAVHVTVRSVLKYLAQEIPFTL